ncbi:TPA: TraR/DksA C4-type zinc finger protein [Stenotrophomonas maltophilia]|nr:TraR/DksA C4-type zinc finger protein [Stenotrophomonas maltophilia]
MADDADQADLVTERAWDRFRLSRPQFNPQATPKPMRDTECEECGAIVPVGRLQAVPGTRHCTACAGVGFRP